MRKIYILGLALFGLSLNAQFTDDFESYPEGPYFGGNWSNWVNSSGANNINVSTDYASSGTKSGNVGGDGVQDAILKLGNKFSGVWTFEHKLYIPTGSSGYFNFQEDETIGADGIWGIEVFMGYIAPDFPDNNSFFVATDPVTSTATYLVGFDHPYDTWFTLRFEYDLDEGTVTAWMDGTELYSGNAYLDSFQLGGVNYYSADPSNNLYIDDVRLVDGPIMGVNDLTASTISVYPTVANDVINISAKSNISEVALYNMSGQQVLKVAPQGVSAQLNVSALPAGVYLVKTSVGKEVKTTKVVVK